MNKNERKTAGLIALLKKDEYGGYTGCLQKLKHARICDFPQGITVSLDKVPFFIMIINDNTVEIMFLETGQNDLFTEGRKFIFPYTVKVDALKDREIQVGDIKLGDHEQEFSAHYIDYSMIVKCRTLLEAVKAGRRKIEEIKRCLDKAVKDFMPRLKDSPEKLYTHEEYLK